MMEASIASLIIQQAEIESLRQQLAEEQRQSDSLRVQLDNCICSNIEIDKEREILEGQLANMTAYADKRNSVALDLQQQLADCEKYLKDGETPAERMARYHHDLQGLMGQLATALNERGNLIDAIQQTLDETGVPALSARPG